jgi:hypothetical protein
MQDPRSRVKDSGSRCHRQTPPTSSVFTVGATDMNVHTGHLAAEPVGEWVFRHAGGCIIDAPDMTTIEACFETPYRWVATMWPDTRRPDGWGVLEWQVAERGWVIPQSLAVGDVIEFGITWADHPRGIDGPTVRWFGWLDNTTTRALIIHGPYHHPTNAAAAARPLIDEIRLDQLAPPTTTDQRVDQ